MPLEVIGAGLQRTGTVTLQHALETLGFKPCYHGFEDANALVRMTQGVAAERDWDEIIGDYRAVVDLPLSIFYKELAQKYPRSKVILTVRDPNVWYDSIEHLSNLNTFKSEASKKNEAWLNDQVSSSEFGRRLKDMFKRRDRGSMVAMYMRRKEEAELCIPRDRLLVYDVRQGWKPLCSFLEVPEPRVEFPHVNSRSSLEPAAEGFVAAMIRVLETST